MSEFWLFPRTRGLGAVERNSFRFFRPINVLAQPEPTERKNGDFSLNSTIPELPGSGWLAAEREATPQMHRLRPWGFPTVSPSHPSVFPHHGIQRIRVELSENSRFVRRICPSGDILKEGGRLVEIGPRSVFVNLVDGVMH